MHMIHVCELFAFVVRRPTRHRCPKIDYAYVLEPICHSRETKMKNKTTIIKQNKNP